MFTFFIFFVLILSLVTHDRRDKFAVFKANTWQEHQAHNFNKALCDELRKIADTRESMCCGGSLLGMNLMEFADQGEKFRSRAHTLAAGTIGRLPFKLTSIEQVEKLRQVLFVCVVCMI